MTEEHRVVHVLLQAARTVLRRRRLGAGPDSLRETEAALQAAFAPVWTRMPQLVLEVRPEGIVLDAAVVSAAGDDEEGLVSALTEAGIRQLIVHPGAELEEIKLVLAAVSATQHAPERDGPDLLTALFRADLHYVRYVVQGELRSEEEGPQPDSTATATGTAPAGPRIAPSPSAPTASPHSVRETVRSEVATAPDRTVVRLEEFDSTLYFLDQREIEYLKSAIDREYNRDLALGALEVLLDVLELRPESAVRSETIGVLRDFLPELLGAGRFEAVARLVEGVRDASRNAVDLTTSQKEALDKLRGSISQPGALSQLFHALEDGAVAPSTESMDVLLRELRPDAVREVLTWTNRLGNDATRPAVEGALDSLFTEWPHCLSRMLDSSDREVVLAGLDLAGRLKRPEFTEIVGAAADHADARIRRRAATTLAALGSSGAYRRLLDMAEDSDRDVRIVVYRTFAARPFRGAFRALEHAITGSNVEEKGPREKRILFEAFGAVAGPEGIGVLGPLLRGKNPSGPRPSSHTRACAAKALGIVGTPAAREALAGAANDRDPLVRSAVNSALRGER
jgi:hypothetical protein